jgi:four helix bundle protein
MDKNFTDLEIWQQAHRLTIEIYKLSGKFPKQEMYGLVSQIRRAAVSVELNIAESYGRFHFAEEINFLFNTRGSAREVQCCLLIAKDLDFVRSSQIDKIYLEYTILTKRVNSYINYKKKIKNAK